MRGGAVFRSCTGRCSWKKQDTRRLSARGLPSRMKDFLEQHELLSSGPISLDPPVSEEAMQKRKFCSRKHPDVKDSRNEDWKNMPTQPQPRGNATLVHTYPLRRSSPSQRKAVQLLPRHPYPVRKVRSHQRQRHWKILSFKI